MWDLPKAQRLLQRGERDCGVFVFAELSGVPEQTIRDEMPGATLGEVSVQGWMTWLQEKGFQVTKREGCPNDIVPCAHLVANNPQSERDFHWVFRDADGDVHNPDPAFSCMSANDPRMRSLEFYDVHWLTITVEP